MSKKIKKTNGIFYVVISLFIVFSLLFTGMPILMAYSVGQTINTTVNTQGGDYIYNEATDEAPINDVTLGAFSGPDIYQDLNIRGAVTTGGTKGFSTTTRDATHTLTFNDLNRYTFWSIENGEESYSNLTYTFPATSTMMLLLPDVGSTRTWQFEYATSTLGTTITFAPGNGMVFRTASSTAEILSASSTAVITCMQIFYRDTTNENIVCMVENTFSE